MNKNQNELWIEVNQNWYDAFAPKLNQNESESKNKMIHFGDSKFANQNESIWSEPWGQGYIISTFELAKTFKKN